MINGGAETPQPKPSSQQRETFIAVRQQAERRFAPAYFVTRAA